MRNSQEQDNDGSKHTAIKTLSEVARFSAARFQLGNIPAGTCTTSLALAGPVQVQVGDTTFGVVFGDRANGLLSGDRILVIVHALSRRSVVAFVTHCVCMQESGMAQIRNKISADTLPTAGIFQEIGGNLPTSHKMTQTII